MKLIVGLWNPWEKYNKTKHNIWFMFIDYIRDNYNLPSFKFESKFKAEVSIWTIWSEKSILLKPQTFMNLSWEAIVKISHFYKIDKQDIIIIYDDMSMEFWKIRFRDKWSAWWHNWIKNIIIHMWNEFKRIKIWIWYNNNYEVSDWVLSKFNNDQLKEINDNTFPKVYTILKEKL